MKLGLVTHVALDTSSMGVGLLVGRACSLLPCAHRCRCPCPCPAQASAPVPLPLSLALPCPLPQQPLVPGSPPWPCPSPCPSPCPLPLPYSLPLPCPLPQEPVVPQVLSTPSLRPLPAPASQLRHALSSAGLACSRRRGPGRGSATSAGDRTGQQGGQVSATHVDAHRAGKGRGRGREGRGRHGALT